MSGECDKCGEHTLECSCNTEKQVGFLFQMPCGEVMKIRSSKPIDYLEIPFDEEIEGITYQIHWSGLTLPWGANTLLHANIFALGVQCGAKEMYKKLH